MSAASAFEPGLEGEAVTEHCKRTVSATSAKAPVEPKQASSLTERPEVKICQLPHRLSSPLAQGTNWAA